MGLVFMDVEQPMLKYCRKERSRLHIARFPLEQLIVRVTNLENGRYVNVRINDRGPFKYHRLIDLAHGAANELKMMRPGEINVSLELIN